MSLDQDDRPTETETLHERTNTFTIDDGATTIPPLSLESLSTNSSLKSCFLYEFLDNEESNPAYVNNATSVHGSIIHLPEIGPIPPPKKGTKKKKKVVCSAAKPRRVMFPDLKDIPKLPKGETSLSLPKIDNNRRTVTNQTLPVYSTSAGKCKAKKHPPIQDTVSKSSRRPIIAFTGGDDNPNKMVRENAFIKSSDHDLDDRKSQHTTRPLTGLKRRKQKKS